MILITSDHHYWPYPQFARQLENGVNSRLAEMLEVEDFLFELMKKHKVTHHIRAGDLWERKNILDAVTYSEVRDCIRRNVEAGITEVLLVGNHDIAAGGVRNGLEGLKEKDVRVVDRPYLISLYGGGRILCLPYSPDVAVTMEELEHGTAGDAEILVAHLSVEGAKTGSEFSLPGQVSLEDLHADRYDHVFLGHIHEPQTFPAPYENVHYIGSLTQRSFADSGSQRRAILLEPQSVSSNGGWESIPLPGPRFETVKVGSKASIKRRKPDSKTYYRIAITDPDVSQKAIAEHFDGQCRGWTSLPAWTKEKEGTRPRLTLHKRWEDVCANYIKQTETKLNKAALLKKANETIAEANYV
jgi:DNA repair exonuclease SbcCD nuclease subunit